MVGRIITRGLKTGTGPGGVKYILRKGLLSSAYVPPTLSQVNFTFIAMNQSILTDIAMSQSRLTDINILE
jgi:hypothetical protein